MPDRLNDEEFDARLMRRLAEENDAEDLDSVPEADEDAEDLLTMQRMLGSYREESLEWAEQRSASMPSPLPARSSRFGWLHAPQWALGTAALCACVLGGAVYTHHQAALAETAANVLPAAPTQQALASDNQLLLSVDDALHTTVAPSEQELGLTNELLGDRAQTRRHAEQRSN